MARSLAEISVPGGVTKTALVESMAEHTVVHPDKYIYCKRSLVDK